MRATGRVGGRSRAPRSWWRVGRAGVVALAAVATPLAAGAQPAPAPGAGHAGGAPPPDPAAMVSDATGTGPLTIDAGRVELILPRAELLPRARSLLEDAEAALDAAAAFWDVPPPRVTVVVRDGDDLFNAWVDPLGGPIVSLPLQRAWPGEVGADAEDPGRLLLVHEMIHAVHFGGRPGSLPVPTGLVGADLPWPPPSWLLEGVAVWAESRLLDGGGGRLHDPDARSVLRVLARDGPWPSLADAALISHAAWPGGRLRYLAGGALVERLIDRAGLPAFRDALRRFETQAPWLGFDHAWRATTGGDVAAEWDALRDELAAEARALSDHVGAELARGRAPARSPDGTRLAWLDGATVRVAAWTDAGPLGEARSLPLAGAPDRLAWWGDDRLVYARLRGGPDGRLRELHALDLASGRETRLTRGARGRDPAATADGCLAFVRDDGPGASQLRRWCPGGPPEGAVLWRPPSAARIVGLAASPLGALALVMDEGGRRSLLRLDPARSSPASAAPLPAPRGALRDPVWEGEDALWVATAADGPGAGTSRDAVARTGAWRIDLRTGRASLRAAPRGGVLEVAPGVVAARRAGGPVLARVGDAAIADPLAASGAPVSPPSRPSRGGAPERPERPPEPRPYDPRAEVRLLGWLPTAAAGGVGVRVPAVDPARRYGATAVAGVAPSAEGPLGPVWAGIELRVGDAGPVRTPAPSAAATFEARAGVLPVAPHRERALGPRLRLDAALTTRLAWEPSVRLRLEGTAQLLADRPRLGGAIRMDVADGHVDAWGVPVRGWAAAATLRSDPLPTGSSNGAWLDGVAWLPVGGGGGPVTSLALRAGWRPPAPAPGTAWRAVDLSAAASATWTVPVRARLADGRWALERLRLGPTVRVGTSLGGSGPHLAYGFEAELHGDLVLGYGAPVSTGLRAGLAWGGRGPAEGWLRWALPGLP